MMKRRKVARRLIVILGAMMMMILMVHAKKTPEASSTLLKMHRLYMSQPPHDDSLYNILSVSPNATQAEITKSYRRLTRALHPDKHHHPRHSSHFTQQEREERLQQVQEAYEVLKDDSTRLPYHRFGLLDTSFAAFLLTGGRVQGTTISPSQDQERLLQMMGFYHTKQTHQQRVFFLAANLLERIRPLVEGAIDESVIADLIAQECDTLKRVPLGAQIIRCIGRAYRHSGQRVLRKHHRRAKLSLFRPLHVGAELSDVMRDKMRDAKQVFTAAVASGRLVLTEKMTQRESKSKQDSLNAIDYHMDDGLSRIDELIGEEDVHDLDSHLESDEQLKETARLKAQAALLESLQVEALWKITKIDLDRTIQEACNLILTGEYFFFPSHQSVSPEWRQHADGWVGSTGEAVDANVGKLRAAAALIMIGDIMVRCSKEGTAWME